MTVKYLQDKNVMIKMGSLSGFFPQQQLTGLAGVLGHVGEPISKSSCCGWAPGDALGGAK